jgi:hypothetical protein
MAQAIRLKRRFLATEAALDEGDDDIERAVAGEVFVTGLGREPALLRLGRGIEQRPAKAR